MANYREAQPDDPIYRQRITFAFGSGMQFPIVVTLGRQEKKPPVEPDEPEVDPPHTLDP